MKLFVPHEALDSWLSSDKMSLDGENLYFSGTNTHFRLVPGCFFKSIQAGHDEAGLLGKVKTKAAVTALGAEICMNSVILGETAYEVETGFVAKTTGGEAADAAIASAIARL